jgi:hypothetical protein
MMRELRKKVLLLLAHWMTFSIDTRQTTVATYTPLPRRIHSLIQLFILRGITVEHNHHDNSISTFIPPLLSVE